MTRPATRSTSSPGDIGQYLLGGSGGLPSNMPGSPELLAWAPLPAMANQLVYAGYNWGYGCTIFRVTEGSTTPGEALVDVDCETGEMVLGLAWLMDLDTLEMELLKESRQMARRLHTGVALLVAATALIACSSGTPGPASASVSLAFTPTRRPDPTASLAATATPLLATPAPPVTPTGTATASGTPTRIATADVTPTAIPPCFVSYPAPIAFMPDGARIVVQAEAGAQIFNLQTMREEAFLDAPARLVSAATALSPDGTTLAWALEDDTIQLVRVADRQVIHTLRGHTDVVGKLRFSPAGDRLFSASHDSWVRIWDMDGRQVGAFQPLGGGGYPNEVLGLGISPDGAMIATLPFDGPAKLWDGRNYALIKELGAFGGFEYSDIAFSPDGQLIVADTANGLFLWRTADGTELLGGNPGINSMAGTFSPDGRLLAYADLNDVVLSSPDGMHERRRLVGHSSPVWQLVFSPDSALLMSADGIGIRLWRVDSGDLLSIGERACP